MEIIIMFLVTMMMLNGYNGLVDKRDGVVEVHNYETRCESECSKVR